MPKRVPEYKSKNPSDIDWARMAAYIDGEGCIRIRKRDTSTGLLVVIGNNDPRLMVWLKENFSGHIVERKELHRKCTYYRWEAAYCHAGWVLENCFKYFIIKRDQAELGLAHQALAWRGGRLDRTEALSARMNLKKRLSLLKGTASQEKDEHGVRINAA